MPYKAINKATRFDPHPTGFDSSINYIPPNPIAEQKSKRLFFWDYTLLSGVHEVLRRCFRHSSGESSKPKELIESRVLSQVPTVQTRESGDIMGRMMRKIQKRRVLRQKCGKSVVKRGLTPIF